MKQEFKGQQVSFIVNDDQTGFAFTAHDVAEGTRTEDVMFFGSQFAYSVLGVNNAKDNGATVNENGSITGHFLVR